MKPAKKAVLRFDPDLALSSYVKDPDLMPKTGIGGIINAVALVSLILTAGLLAPVSLALMGLANGYVLRHMRFRVGKQDSPLPDWDEWLDLFVSGITWLALQFGYALIIISVATISFMLCEAINRKNPEALIPICMASAFMFLLTSAITHFFTSYLMINFAAEEKLSAGFGFRRVFEVGCAAPKPFLLAWMLSIGIQVLAIVVPALTIIGIFLVPNTYFAAQIISANLLTQAWAVGIKNMEDQQIKTAKEEKKANKLKRKANKGD
jgi:hypothetical protein